MQRLFVLVHLAATRNCAPAGALAASVARDAGSKPNHGSAMWCFALTAAVALALALPTRADATPDPIAGYDVTEFELAPGWTHDYSGPASFAGFVSDFSFGGFVPLLSEAGGVGSLADGTTSETTAGTYLFATGTDVNGLPIRPTIAIRLAQPVRLRRIVIQGGATSVPYERSLTTVTVAVGDVAAAVPTQTVRPDAFGHPADRLLDLRDTPLADMATDELVLRDFVSPSPPGHFSAAEILIDGVIEGAPDLDPPEYVDVSNPAPVRSADPEGAPVYFTPIARDDVDGFVPVTCDPRSGSIFPPGETLVICYATDAAGNRAALNLTVSVTLTPSALCRLTADYVSRSALYQALPARADANLKGLVSGACRPLDRILANSTPAQTAALVKLYDKAVDALTAARWLTVDQGSRLKLLASAI